MIQTLKQDTLNRAVAKLREYSADDFVCAEHLAELLTAHDQGNSQKFLAQCREQLPHYAACHWSIDELLQFAESTAQ